MTLETEDVRIPFLPVYEIARKMVNGERVYSTPDGDMYSVTTILSGSEDQTGLMEWREGIGEKRANEIVEAACWRGDKHHLNIENWLKTGVEPEFNFIQTPYWESTRKFLDTVNGNLLIEGAVWHPDGFAGMVDFVGYSTEFGNRPVLFDWKTADRICKPAKIYKYSLQLAAYRAALNHVYGRTHGLQIDFAQLVVAIPCQSPQIEVFDAEALDQLYRHFLGRKERFLTNR